MTLHAGKSRDVIYVNSIHIDSSILALSKNIRNILWTDKKNRNVLDEQNL